MMVHALHAEYRGEGHAGRWRGRACWEIESQDELSDGQKGMLGDGESGHTE